MAYLKTISSLGCPELELGGILALAARHGVEAVELRSLAGSIDLLSRLVDGFGAPSALARRLRGESVKVVGLDTSFKLIGSTEAERIALLEHVPWAEAIGARLRVFDGGRPDDPAGLDEMVGTLTWWRQCRLLNRWETDLMVETHDSLLTARAIRALLRRVPGTAILWDAHHTWRQGGEDPLATWPAIRDDVVHVHVKDSVVAADVPAGFRYCLPGDGGFPMASLQAVLGRECNGPVSLEWERLWHPDLPPLDAALRTAAERCWW